MLANEASGCSSNCMAIFQMLNKQEKLLYINKMDLKSRPVLPLEIVIEEVSIEQRLNKPRNPCCKIAYQNDSERQFQNTVKFTWQLSCLHW